MELFYAKLMSGNPRFAPPLPFSHSYANSPASVLAIECKLRAHHVVLSSGRNAGALALQSGFDAIALGRADRIVAAASDSLSRPAFRAYYESGALLPDGVSGDASGDEKRFVMGEGGACLVMEEANAAHSRGARVLARVLSVGSATDGDPVLAVEDAVRQSLVLGGTAPRSVTSAIGTGASSFDRSNEARGLAAALELAEPDARALMKPLGAILGETMGASGMLACLAALGESAKMPTVVVSLDRTPPRPAAVALLIAAA
jgi:3-oxoacyl-(acyl-carrier-protein) synthase